MMRENSETCIKTLIGLVIFCSVAILSLQARTQSVFDQVSVEQLTQGPQGPPYLPQGPIAIVGGLLIDATDAPPQHDQTVLIDGDRIIEVGPWKKCLSQMQHES